MRIEGFDISNLGETHTVASMVVFEGGAPKKSDYRKFKIRGDFDAPATAGPTGPAREREAEQAGPDDFAAMQEVLARRMGALHGAGRHLARTTRDRDASFAALPDLIVIDGGKGQLSAGMKALEPLLERGVTVISLAKRIEEVFVPGRPDSIRLEQGSGRAAAAPAGSRRGAPLRDHLPSLRRDKAMTASVLDGVRGVGPARKRALLRPLRLARAPADREPRGARSGARGAR